MRPTTTGTATPVVLRTNQATHPAGKAYVTATGPNLGWGTARWFGGGSANGTYTNVTGAVDGPPGTGVTSYARKTWTVGGGGNGDIGFQTNAWTGFVAGATYTVSAWFRSSVARTDVGWEVQAFDTSGMVQRTNAAGSYALPANTWTRFTWAFTVPPGGATNIMFVLDTDVGTTPVVGTTFDVAGLLVEQAGTPAAVQRTNLHTNPSLGRNATNWAATTGGGTFTVTRETTMGVTTGTLPAGGSTPWFKMTATVTNANSPVGAQTQGATVGTGAAPVIVGQSYTFAAYHVSSFATTNIRIEWSWLDAAGAVLSGGASTFVTNTANAWQRLTAQSQVAPAGAVAVRVNVNQSAAAGSFPVGGYVGVTGVQIEQATTLGAYFDGSNVGNRTSEYHWTGVPFNSTSDSRGRSTGE